MNTKLHDKPILSQILKKNENILRFNAKSYNQKNASNKTKHQKQKSYVRVK